MRTRSSPGSAAQDCFATLRIFARPRILLFAMALGKLRCELDCRMMRALPGRNDGSAAESPMGSAGRGEHRAAQGYSRDAERGDVRDRGYRLAEPAEGRECRRKL